MRSICVLSFDCSILVLYMPVLDAVTNDAKRMSFCCKSSSCLRIIYELIFVNAIEMNRFFIGFFHVTALFVISSRSKWSRFFSSSNEMWHVIWIDALGTVHAFLHHFIDWNRYLMFVPNIRRSLIWFKSSQESHLLLLFWVFPVCIAQLHRFSQ